MHEKNFSIARNHKNKTAVEKELRSFYGLRPAGGYCSLFDYLIHDYQRYSGAL